jgi:predicted transcriptional regulator
MNLFQGIIDDKLLRVLKLFFNNPDEYYHINKVSQDTKVPLATTFRIINNLSENEIIEFHKIAKFKIYRLAKNKKTRELRKII